MPLRKIIALISALFLWWSPPSFGNSHVSAALSAKELQDLVRQLASKVDIFQEVWKLDPEAQFYGGTSRDFIYWIVGQFQGIGDRSALEAKKQELLKLPLIEIRMVVGPTSDIDVMSNESKISSILADDFSVRKIDRISFDRLNPESEVGKSEVDQGFIPVEKIVLGINGIQRDERFGDGLSEILVGKLSVTLPDPEKFWTTYYAKAEMNHPILLAVRYIRILAQDYLRRRGDKYPDMKVLLDPMDTETYRLIQSMMTMLVERRDPRFEAFLKNKKGLVWLNGSLQKAFRSYSHPTAAYLLMKELGVLNLVAAYSDSIESLNGFLLQAHRDYSKITSEFKRWNIRETDILISVEKIFPDLKLYHGSENEAKFRSIIFQNFIPSEGGTAGRGVYGVSKKDISFARSWKNSEDFVIALSLSQHARVVDITEGPGKDFYETWLRQANLDPKLSPEDQFSEIFGIDILKYPYGDVDAFVLKNSSVIEKRDGVFRRPRSIVEFINSLEVLEKNQNLREEDIVSFVQDLALTKLNRYEFRRIFSYAPGFFRSLLEEVRWKLFENREFGTPIQNLQVWLAISIARNLSDSHSLAWARIKEILINADSKNKALTLRSLEYFALPSDFWEIAPLLLKDANKDVRRSTSALLSSQPWPDSFWKVVHEFLESPDKEIRWHVEFPLYSQREWPSEFWDIVPRLLRSKVEGVSWSIASSIKESAVSWPEKFWEYIPSLLKSPQIETLKNTIYILGSRTDIPLPVWRVIHSHLMDPDGNVRFRVADMLSNISSHLTAESSRNRSISDLGTINGYVRVEWPDFILNSVPKLMKDPDPKIRHAIAYALQLYPQWTLEIWRTIEELFSDSNKEVRERVLYSLRNQKIITSKVWELILRRLDDDELRPKIHFLLEAHEEWPQEIIDYMKQTAIDSYESLRELVQNGKIKPIAKESLNHGVEANANSISLNKSSQRSAHPETEEAAQPAASKKRSVRQICTGFLGSLRRMLGR